MKRKMINTFLFASILSAITALTGSCSSNDDNYIDTEAPAEVTFLSGIAADGQVILNWIDPADNDFNRVEISYPQESTPVLIEKGVQTATITGLINGTAYTFTLKTMDTIGNKSTGITTTHTPISTDPDDKTPPAEVTGLSGTAGNMQVILHWTDPTDTDFVKVNITYSPGSTTTIEIGKGAQTAVITGLTNDTEYSFTLKTVDASGNESTGVISEPFTPTAPDFPQSGESKAFTINGVSFNMIAVEGGTFTMGSDAEAAKSGVQRENQKNEHQVTLSSYWIGETEVTIALWNAVMGSGGGSNQHPIASITRNQSVEFASRLNKIAHEQGLIPDDVNFQIPTEAQWEFAAKGGNKSKGYTYSGSNTLSQVGWTSSDGGSVHAVKQKSPNELGIYDMSGNVYEWVYDLAAAYTKEAKINPCNTSGSGYIKRGGSFYYNDAYRFTSTYRYFYTATDYTIGTRICLY